MNAYCNECGKPSPTGSNVCQHCGAKISKRGEMVFFIVFAVVGAMVVLFLSNLRISDEPEDIKKDPDYRRLGYDLCVKGVMNGTAKMYECEKFRN